jgi:hypothetical protein
MFINNFLQNSPSGTADIHYSVRTASETPGELAARDDGQFCRRVLSNVNDRFKSATFHFRFQFHLRPGKQIKSLVVSGKFGRSG